MPDGVVPRGGSDVTRAGGRSSAERALLVVCFVALAVVASAVGAEQDEATRLYEAACAVCHGADGAGAMPGVPDLTARDGPLRKPEAVLVRNTLTGIERPGAPGMPPKGGNPALTEPQIRALVRYMRTAFVP